jgi:DNA-binding transcriptional ArsR family regulator
MARGDVRIDDPRVLRALAHPARLAILEHLQTAGTATATECAAPAGVSPAAASYHLRLLERYGLVADAGGPSKRDRPWRAVVSGFTVSDDGPAGRALGAQLVARGERWTQEYLAAQHDLPRAWRDASHVANKTLKLTPAEARALADAIDDLCDEYRRPRDDAPDDAEDVKVFVRVFPARVRRR